MNALQILALALRLRWRTVLLCVVAGCLGSCVAVLRTPTTYAADAKLLLDLSGGNDAASAADELQLLARLLPRYAVAATSVEATDRARRLLGDVPLSAQVSLAVEPEPGTLLLRFTATGASRQEAQAVAAAAVSAFIDTAPPAGQGPGLALRTRVVDAPLAKQSRSSPQPVRSVLLGCGIGLLGGLVTARFLVGVAGPSGPG